MSWKYILRKGTKTATDTAIMWSNDDYDLYQNIIAKITSLVKSGNNKENIIIGLAIILPEWMAHLDKFMEDLGKKWSWRGQEDAINEVDWEKVARRFEDEIDTIIEDNA